MTSIEIPVEEAPKFERVVVPKGVYQAQIKGTRTWTDPSGRTNIIIDFTFLDGPGTGRTIGGWTSPRITSGTKLGKWLTSLKYQFKPGEKFSMDALVGKKCSVLTDTKTHKKTGEQFSVVVDVLPLPEAV